MAVLRDIILITYWVHFCMLLVAQTPAMQETPGLIPGLGRSPAEGNSYPLQCPGLENSMDWIVQGVTKSRTRAFQTSLALTCPPCSPIWSKLSTYHYSSALNLIWWLGPFELGIKSISLRDMQETTPLLQQSGTIPSGIVLNLQFHRSFYICKSLTNIVVLISTSS